jgi:protein gp37
MGELFDPTLTSDAFLKLADIMSEFNGKHTFMLLTRRPMVMLEWVTQFCEKHKID